MGDTKKQDDLDTLRILLEILGQRNEVERERILRYVLDFFGIRFHERR